MIPIDEPCETPLIACPRVVLPDISHAFHESPRPVLMPESYLLDLLASVSNGKIRIRPEYSAAYTTPQERRTARGDLLWLFFAHRAPLGFLQEFLLELVDYTGGNDWMVRLRGALEQFLREDEEIPGRSLGSSMELLDAIRARKRNPDLDQQWAGNHSLLAEYFMGAALLWRLRRDQLLSARDEELIAQLSSAASVDTARCDVITQILRLQCLPWRETLTMHYWEGPKKGQKHNIPVLDMLIELFWDGLEPLPKALEEFSEPDETPDQLRNRLRFLLREIAALDVSACHVLNPGFAYYPPKELNLAFVRSVGRDGVNTFVLVLLKGDRVVKRSLVPLHIHPTVAEYRRRPMSVTPHSEEDEAASWKNLEDARLGIFQDEKDGRYKIHLTYIVAGGSPMPLLESTTIDVENMLAYLDQQPVHDVSEWAGFEELPSELREVETLHAQLVVDKHRDERKSVAQNGKPVERSSFFITDPVHPLLIPENREALMSLGIPRAVYEDPDATVKDAARSRQKLSFGPEERVVDIWEFRSKKGGDEFLNTSLYRGRYQNPEPSWIGRVALDPETSRIVAVPLMLVGNEWRFRPYLISEDWYAWIGGSSQRDVVEMCLSNPVTGRDTLVSMAMNVIHTTEEVSISRLPYWLQPTQPQPHIALWKYELRLTLELNPFDPFAEPLVYPGTAATPQRLEDWVGWVGRVKFNNNFSVRAIRAKPLEGGSAQDRSIFEFLLAGGDHVVQHAWCELDSLRPLELPWNEKGELALPPLTPFVNPETGERYNFDC